MASDNSLTHIDADGAARMVDVGDKPTSQRTARAAGRVLMQPATLAAIRDGNLKKGDVLNTARLAGILGAKQTAHLIPLCHPLYLSHIDVELTIDEDANAVNIHATCRTSGQTGVEMEALTAVNVAALTVYDMAKAMDREMRITDIRLIEKTGGTRGDYHADDA
ncbi:MAG: cyclic pyranopterin monophosphate synthase MoaC [Anaerolineales bacterium]